MATPNRKPFPPIPESFIARCEEILAALKPCIPKRGENESTIEEKSSKELEQLKKDILDPPKLKVAVYGESASGKSSLLNALLDQSSLVPASAMGNACTSVAIKIEENTTDAKFKADVKFLTKQEWDEEIQALERDTTGNTGDDDNVEITETARAKLTAVYGEFELEHLSKLKERKTDVTACLGTVKHIQADDARSLHDEILPYIETNDDDQFWAIVNQIVLKVPDSQLCKNGTDLVDLPGIGDSNAARDNVAKKHLQSCDVLLIVVPIARAADNKKLKEILEDKQFRQLLMDRRKAVVVCTKSDENVSPAEVIRKCKVKDKWTEEIKQYIEEEKTLEGDLNQLIKEQVTKARPAEQARINEMENKLKHVKNKRAQLVKEKTSTCAEERNAYVKRNVKERVAKLAGSNEEFLENVKIFCVSSKNYAQQRGLFTIGDDGNVPLVYITEEQTEIPKLRNHLDDTARRKQAMKADSLRKDFEAMVSGLSTFLSNSEHGGTVTLEEILTSVLENMRKEMEKIITEVDGDLGQLFGEELEECLTEGRRNAEKEAEQTCENWSRPVNTRNRAKGGLHHSTYKATVGRFGRFSSPRIGLIIDFNEDLANPFRRTISVPWSMMFSEERWDEFIEKIKAKAQNIITVSSKELVKSLEPIVQKNPLQSILRHNLDQMKYNAIEKLHHLTDIWATVEDQQREITSDIPMDVQASMADTYRLCMNMVGIQGIRDEMKIAVNRLKGSMFRNIKDKVNESLDRLKNDITNKCRKILEDIVEDHRKQIEPLWEAHGRSEFIHAVKEIRPKTEQLLKDVQKYGKEHAVQFDDRRKRKAEDQGASTSFKVSRIN